MSQVYAYREPPARMSATTISSFSDCEEQSAYVRLYKDVPPVSDPLPLVFGRVIHIFHERLWNGPKENAEGIKNYGMVFLKRVFAGDHGSEGESYAPESIGWLSRRQMEELSASEIKEKIEEKKKQYMGKGYLALEALYLDRIAPSPFVRTEVEFDIKKHDIVLKDNHASLALHLSGYIDRLQFLGDGSYDLLDVKTGNAGQTYKRNTVVRNIQMTVYQLAGYRIFGQNPRRMFIFALGGIDGDRLEWAREDVLSGRPPKAFEDEKVRISFGIRKAVHFTNLARIAADVRSVMRMIIHPEEFQKWEFENWEPLSDWGKLADFGDNIRERRFIPRIGSGCSDCPYIELCKHDNSDDWKKYRESLSVGTEPTVPHDAAVVHPVPEPEPQGVLFETLPKPKPLRKSDREINRELKETGLFPKSREIQGEVKRIHKLIPPLPDGTLCPCRRLDRVPVTLLECLGEYRKGTLSIAKLLAKCPYKECPHRTASDK